MRVFFLTPSTAHLETIISLIIYAFLSFLFIQLFVFCVICSIGQNISSYLPDQLSGALAALATYVAKAANPVSLY
jgi:hypothetical protein